jgi:tRNA threonylcarbamoyladenosine biosynthesis protein TsaE
MAKSKRLTTPSTSIFKKKVLTKTTRETRNLGKKFAPILKSGEIVFLKGDFGSGKTIFSQGIIKAFGNKNFARSSSFAIINEYNLKNLKLFHIDLYRLEPSNIWDIGIEEYIYSKNISIIEWADRLVGIEDDNHWDVEIKIMGSKREIKIEKKK